jgi:hypothetical protein
MLVCEQLQNVANTVVRRAQRQGYVVPRDIRDELIQAGLPESRWKEVVGLARESLNCRQGRYYHLSAFSPRLQEEQQHQQQIQRAVRRLIRQYQASPAGHERRQQDRVDFIQPVKVQTEDGREFTLLSRDLSTSGIRLIGTRRLLGQKVRVHLPRKDQDGTCCLLVRILWTCALGDDMFENGGSFVEVIGD